MTYPQYRQLKEQQMDQEIERMQYNRGEDYEIPLEQIMHPSDASDGEEHIM